MKLRLALLCLLSSLPLSAQIPPVVQEIVVTGSALPESRETAPVSVTIITTEEIEERAARDVADVLRAVPGFTISRSGSRGKTTSLFSRGGNSTHSLVLWNGIEINNPYFAGYDWGRFSTAGVERIEIVRGPFSALYGSEAISGVVNVLTSPRKSGISLDLQLGQQGLRNALAEARWVGSRLTGTASLEQRDDEGWAPNDDFAQTAASAGARWSPSSDFSIGLQARGTTYDLGIPFNSNAEGTALTGSPHRRQSGEELQIAIPVFRRAGRLSYDLTLSESRRVDDFEDPDDPFGFTAASTDSVTRRLHLLAHTTTSFGSVSVGGELERAVVDDSSSFGIALDGSVRTSRALFVEDRISRTLSAGSRVELSLGIRHDDFDQFGSETSPRIAAALVTGHGTWRASYGEGFRAPSIGELYFPFSGNRDLRAERSRSAEIGLDRSFGDALVSVTLFRSRLHDLIVFDNQSFLFQNIGRASSSGAELSAEGKLSPSVHAGMSYTFLRTEQEETGEALLRRPRHSGTLFVGGRRDRLEAIATLQHSGRRPDLLPVAPFAVIDAKAYTTADLTFRYRLELVTPYLKIENLANTEYQEVTGYPSPGRRALIGVRLTLE